MKCLPVVTSLSAFILMALIAASQSPDPFAKTITEDELKEHMYRIASPEMEGRETATEGQRKAAAYLEEQFKLLRMAPGWNGGYQQTFPVFRDSLVNAAMIVNGADLKLDSHFLVTSNSGFNMAVDAKEVLFAGFGLSDSIRNDYQNLEANGKVVLVWHGAPTKTVNKKKIRANLPDYYTLQNAAKKNGAAALIIVQERFVKGATPRVGRMYVHDYRKDSIPNTFIISDSVARMIVGDNANRIL